MSTFREQVKKDAEVRIKQESDEYRNKLNEIQQNNASILKETKAGYAIKQEKLANRMTEMIDKKSTESDQRLKNEVNGIKNDLLCDPSLVLFASQINNNNNSRFNDPNKLFNKIKKATQDLEKVRSSTLVDV